MKLIFKKMYKNLNQNDNNKDKLIIGIDQKAFRLEWKVFNKLSVTQQNV